MILAKLILASAKSPHNDKDLLINGRPINLRLTHDGGEFPLTGYPAMDVASWKKIIQTCKDYGLNGIRFHSWCPPEAAFEAADELGFYLQPECGLWADFGSPADEAMAERRNRAPPRGLRQSSVVHFAFAEQRAAQLLALHAAMGGRQLCERPAPSVFRRHRLVGSVAGQRRRAICHARPLRQR